MLHHFSWAGFFRVYFLLIFFYVGVVNSAFAQKDKVHFSTESALANPAEATILNLSGQDLLEIPKEIPQLINLKILLLNNNQIKELPAFIGSLKNLEVLDLDSNLIRSVPLEIGNLSKLNRLDMSNNEIDQVPSTFSNLQNLETLYLQFNKFTFVPQKVLQLQNLKSLDISYNRLSDLGENIGNLRNLTYLNAQENKLSLIPESLFTLHKLSYLDLGHNNISSIDYNWTQLPDLKNLSLDANQIHQIPANFSSLQQLDELDLSKNPIRKMPESLYNFFIKLNNARSDEVAILVDKIREEKEIAKQRAENAQKEAVLRTQIAETEKERANAIAEKEQEGREKAEAQTKMATAEQLRQKANADKANAEKKYAQKEQEAQAQENERNILFFSVFALALFGIIFLIYRNAQQQHQKNKIITEQSKALQAEKEKADQLLLNILPHEVAQELKEKGITQVRHFKNASVLFADIKGFSALAKKLSPEDLIKELDFCFSKFDEIVKKFNLERIKTIGDSYMCAGGVPVANITNPFDITLASLQIQSWMENERKHRGDDYWQIRLGIHSGELVAGVIGKTRFAYDIWGNTVNTASRMESGGEVGKVNITETTYDIIKEMFHCVPRGKIEAKNIGLIETYFVCSLRPEYALDEEGITPNDKYIHYVANYRIEG